MDYLIIAAQFILSLSLLIVLHEFGHFLPARLFGMRVDKFYLFFDPWFSLVKYKKGDTEYGIGWLPLGGYVKIAGMIDESMDKEQLKQEPQEWEFRSKPAWQRLIVMLGGVTVNFILGILIFIMINFVYGKEYLPMKNLSYGIVCDSVALDLGFQNGDKILSLNDKEIVRFTDFRKELVFADAGATVKVERQGQVETLTFDEEKLQQLTNHRGQVFGVRFPTILDSLPKNSHNAEVDIQKGDRFLTLNATPVAFAHEFLSTLAKQEKGKPLQATLLRGQDTIQRELLVSEKGKLGIMFRTGSQILDFETQHYSFGEAIPVGFQDSYKFLGDYIAQFGLIFNGRVNASESLGGFGSIASLFGSTWEWHRFWRMTAILSIILGFMNLLPIPALDGGHVVFLLYEIVSGRKPNEKVMEYAQLIGLLLVLGLVIFANGMDIYRALT